MDKKLHILHHLYDEADDPAAREDLLADPALRAEFEAMAAVKAALDARPKPQPDVAVLDAVVAAARGAPAARADRPPQPRRAARRFQRIGALSAVLAVVLVVGIGIQQQWLLDPTARDSGALTSPEAVLAAPEAAPADEDATEEFLEAAPGDLQAQLAPAPSSAPAIAGGPQRTFEREPEAPPAPAEAPTLAARRAEPETERADASMAKVEEDFEADQVALDEIVVSSAIVAGRAGDAAFADSNVVLPVWDEADAVQRLHRRLELLEARSSALDWDEIPAVSLDALPAQPTAVPLGVRPVRQKRDGNR